MTKTKHTYLFTRQEGMEGVTAAAVLTLDTGIRHTPLEDSEEAFKLFEAACTDWLNKTDEGKQSWADSGEDFNIGDFLNDGVHEQQSFMNFCQHYGFVVEVAQGVCHDTQFCYDHVLNLQSPLDDDF